MYIYQAMIWNRERTVGSVWVTAKDMGEAVLRAATSEHFQGAVRRGDEPRVTQVVECGKVAQ